MSVSSEQSSVPYVGNASTVTAYTVPFVFFDAADLEVVITDEAGEDGAPLTLNVDYTVSGGDGSRGSVVTTDAIPSTQHVTISRVVPLTQPVGFTDVGRFPSAAVDRALDRLTMQVQQVDRKADRNFDLIDGGHA